MPTPLEIREARRAAGLTQAQAAYLVRAAFRTWQSWEYGEHHMPPLTWEVFLERAAALWGAKPGQKNGPGQ